MTAEQITLLLSYLEKIATKLTAPPTYTITGAADWPVILVGGAAFAAILGVMWRDIRQLLLTLQRDGKTSLEKHATENKADFIKLWDELRACQRSDCPRGGKTYESTRIDSK